MDVSSSVSAEEDALQRGGLAAALIAPEVQAAMFASPLPVALAAFEWSGRYNQELLLDWTLIRSPEDLTRVAETIGLSQRSQRDFPTALGHALGYGAGLILAAKNAEDRARWADYKSPEAGRAGEHGRV